MNSDNYQFSKSAAPQGVDLYTPFQEKQWNWLNDINSGVYSNNSGLTLVQFDLTSIYNSGQFCDTSDLFLTVPIVMTAAFTDVNGGLLVPAANGGSSNLCCLKSNFQHLIHQIEITAGGKTINDTQPFISLYENFKLLSSMSTGDLKQFGSSFGLGEELDSERSVRWSPVAAQYSPQQGVGLCNNRPFVSSTLTGTDTQSLLAAPASSGAINKSLQRRVSRVVDTSLTPIQSSQKIYGVAGTANGNFIMSETQLSAEFKPYFKLVGNVMVWYDLAVIPLKYLCDCLDKIGLVKKLDLGMRIYFNTGSLKMDVTLADATGTNLRYGAVSSSTFANTCPFTISHLPETTANGGPPLGTLNICAGVFIARAPTTAIGVGTGTVNIGNGVVGHPMSAVRCYYSMVKMEPQRQLAYVDANREKQVVYENVIFNQYTAAASASGGTFSQLIQSGIKNPIGLCIIPLIGSGTVPSTGGGTLGFEQWGSPVDTCPSTYAPISLTNLQVSLGGQNVLASTLYYSFETFLEQVAHAETLTGSDLGMAVGLINQSWWEMNRVYWVDLSRGRDADRASMRNLSISFQNNSNVSITLMCFTVYLDKLTIDVETGVVKK